MALLALAKPPVWSGQWAQSGDDFDDAMAESLFAKFERELLDSEPGEYMWCSLATRRSSSKVAHHDVAALQGPVLREPGVRVERVMVPRSPTTGGWRVAAPSQHSSPTTRTLCCRPSPCLPSGARRG